MFTVNTLLDIFLFIGGYSLFSTVIDILLGLEHYLIYGKLFTKSEWNKHLLFDVIACALLWTWLYIKFLGGL